MTDDAGAGAPVGTHEHRGGARRRVLGVAIGVVALAAGLALGALLVGVVLPARAPAEGSVDAGFARDMQRHHEQAVEMSVLVRDRTDDDAVRQLALDIALTQQHQAGQMRGWLDSWGLPPQTAAAPMAWASDHDHGQSPTGQMPGLATPEQMAVLTSATGEEAERVFLQLMIPHHVGGVEMAELAVERADRSEVRRLATAMVRAQEAEITLLESMLAERGGPVPDL